MKAFVTVGTTRFDEMVECVLRPHALDSLKAIGVSSLLLQIGASRIEEDLWIDLFGEKAEDEGKTTSRGVEIEFYRYKPSLATDMSSADVVIGHAGAGTVLECMRLRKPLLVVINERLMDNHQAELAEALQEQNHVLCCIPPMIDERLRDPKLFQLAPYNPPDQRKVAAFIDSRMGVVRQ